MDQDARNGGAIETPESDGRTRIQLVASCLFGTVIAAGAAGLIVSLWPNLARMTVFLGLLVVFAPMFSFVGHWLFILHSDQIAKKLEDEGAARGIVEDD